MPAVTVISATAVPDHLRGALTRWLLEVTPTLYIGTISARVRTELWKNLTSCLTDGNAVLAYPAANEQGFTLHTAGPQRRDPQDFDGLTLIAFQRANESQGVAKLA
ncbi:type I-E CRISPR-associated endoribonuclease Cas2e [Streptomyces sp. NPDC048643]|uniref:type I-E CRISPR-associated endoribonuclease Cas2e n=1 Tax=Streptomyces sp. NPDC048643 TaxID=3155637 RepID=UPI0034290B12